MTDDGRMCKAERLALAGAIAPVLRASAKKARRIAVVDKDGNVTGYRTLGEVQEALLAAKKIELEVEESVRPPDRLCESCGLYFRIPMKVGGIPRFCSKCTRSGQMGGHCAEAGCNNLIQKRAKICRVCFFAKAAQKRKKCETSDCPELVGERSRHCSRCAKNRKETNPANSYCACGSRKNKTSSQCKTCCEKATRKTCVTCGVRATGSSGKCRACWLAGVKVEGSKSQSLGKRKGYESTCVSCNSACLQSRKAKRNGSPPRCRACFLSAARLGRPEVA